MNKRVEMIAKNEKTVEAIVIGTMSGKRMFKSGLIQVNPLILAEETNIPRENQAILKNIENTSATRFSVKYPISPSNWWTMKATIRQLSVVLTACVSCSAFTDLPLM